MSITDICVNIPTYEKVILDQNNAFDLNTTITFLDGFQPPIIFNNNNKTQICGPFIKILEKFSKRLGFK